MKRKWWLLGGGAVLLSLLLSLCFFGVRVRLAPRLVLSRALGTALEQLEERFADSPVHLFAEAIDPEGRQQATLQLETEQKTLGIVRYDMSVQTQLAPCRILAAGTVVTGGRALDLSLYLDGNFAAVSSQSLVEGSFYGITYDSFSQDIRGRQLLAALIGESTISAWEGSVSDLDTAMSRDVTLPKWGTEDIISALYGVLALKPQVSRIDTPAGGSAKTDAVIFRATGQEIAAAAEPYRGDLSPELLSLIDEWQADASACVEVLFLLHKGALMEIQAVMTSVAVNTRIYVTLGTDPRTGPLNLVIITEAGEDSSNTVLKIETTSDETAYRETFSLSTTANGEQSTFSADYTYDLSTGEMDVTILRDTDKAQLRLNLAGEGESVTITTQDITPLLNLFRETPATGPAICTMTISPGTEISVPEYRNLDQWSMEDLLTLLEGFGGLLGLDFL